MAELTLLSSTPGGLTDAQLDRNMQNLNEELAGKQGSHANLAVLSGLGGAADKLPYFTGVGALALADYTPAARTFDAAATVGLQRTALGLGTAAVANLTTSQTDTTAGRVPLVGDFGLGTDSQQTNIDPNTIKYGSIFAPVSQANAPAGECVMWSGGRSAGARAAQFAIDHGFTTRAWSRAYNVGRVGSEWGQWVEHWTSAGTNAVTIDTGSFGYGIGSGGAVTQATSKSTTVTLNKPSGRVTTTADSLAGGASVVFLLNNSKIAAGDVVLASIASAPGASLYEVSAWGVTAGLCYIRVKNIDAAAQAHAVAINFVVIKGAIA